MSPRVQLLTPELIEPAARLLAGSDPDIDHWHLGPAAVERRLQGQGIGRILMTAICDELDQRQANGYLETDKHANVRLYRRGGFEVIAEQPVLGVPNWFMLRHPPLSTRAARAVAA